MSFEEFRRRVSPYSGHPASISDTRDLLAGWKSLATRSAASP